MAQRKPQVRRSRTQPAQRRRGTPDVGRESAGRGLFSALNPWDALQSFGGALYDIYDQVSGGRARREPERRPAGFRAPAPPETAGYTFTTPAVREPEPQESRLPRQYRREPKHRQQHMERHFSPEERRDMGYPY